MKTSVLLLLPLVACLAGCAASNQQQAVSHRTPYTKPLTSPGAKFGALPPSVQLSVLAQVGHEEIVDAVRDTSAGRVVYKIYFRDAEIFPPLYVAPDGSVLNPDLTVAVSARPGTRVLAADVPEVVKKAVHDRAATAEVAYFTKETWGERMVYVVNFKDEAHNRRLFVGEDGTILDEAD